ncbi:hypothetical protein BGZ63DRAFT_362515 [Mariannaea sp. PMI_226]|nr:hypothetical protein BGZ63DRAFT_362515 [Mariannaea sp. PMI_226]
MSRNVRRKFASTPVKVTKRRRRVSETSESSLDLSDEGGYSAVEEISDSSDDDEDDVAAAEEENILEEAEVPTPTAPRPRLLFDTKEIDDDDDDDDDDDENDDDDDDGAEADEDEDEGEGENGSWAGIISEVDEDNVSDFLQEAMAFGSDTPVERHVHFDVPSSDSDSTDTEDDHGDLFPDIFVSQTALDPSFRREIENDPDESSGSGSFWDYTYNHDDQPDSDAEELIRQLSDDDTPTATPMASQPNTVASTPVPAFEEPQELDGYETDGDTTEEDIPEPPIRRKSRRPSNPMSEISDSEADSPVKSQRGQPRLGRFNLDRSDRKPIAVLNPHTRKMMIFTPHRRRQIDLSPEQFNIPWPLEDQTSPILSNSANMMLSAMFSSNTFGDFINTQAMGPAEAFFPFPSEPGTADDSSTAPSLHGDEDEEEKKLDINDFITWDDGDDDDSSGEEDQGKWDPTSTPVRPSTASSEIDVLSHLNSETVGAFRRNQINQQLILSNQATQDSLAFSGPYNYTALKGLKSDRFDTAAVPLTPMRRHKKHMSDLGRSPLESLSAKRKASGDAGNGHKRHRSISDVNFLRI